MVANNFKMELGDEVRTLIDNITDKWLLQIVETNPSILYMFRDKNLKPARNTLPWSGEFAGKYLTGSALFYKITKSDELKKYCEKFIEKLISYQEPNGYLGVYDKEHQLTGIKEFFRDPIRDRTVEKGDTWDLWSHYHIMYGLILWYDILGEKYIFECVERIADLMMNKFYGDDGKRMVDIGWPEMNLAPYHIFAMLYNRTHEKKYLDFAYKIEKDTEDERAGNYIKYVGEGIDYYLCPKPRWESLHIIMGYVEMYRATNDEKYIDAVRQIVYSILKTDVHNTGAFSTDEQAVGNPYQDGNVETCCAIAFNALVCELNSLEPSAYLADFLEISLYNAIMGSFSKSGRWSTYDTPMDGFKKANYHSIVFQSREGSPDMNCCSANAPRGVGDVTSWALLDHNGVTYINYFGKGSYAVGDMEYSIDGSYPYGNSVTLRFESSGKVKIRIPSWSKNTLMTLNGASVECKRGEYADVEVASGDIAEIKFDFSVKTILGEGNKLGKRSFYRGPILLGFDNGENPKFDFDNIPAIDGEMLKSATAKMAEWNTLELHLDNGIVLNDFYSLGQYGSPYRTWLN